MDYTELRLLEIANKICKVINGYGTITYNLDYKGGLFYLRGNDGGNNIIETKYAYAVNLVSDLVDKLYMLKIK